MPPALLPLCNLRIRYHMYVQGGLDDDPATYAFCLAGMTGAHNPYPAFLFIEMGVS
jgi:hypothetical protein